MTRSISIGIDAKKAFDFAIPLGILTGITIEQHTLSFEYTGMTPNDALQRAVDNHQALRDAADKESDDDRSYLLNYAASYLAVAVDELTRDYQAVIATPTPTPVVKIAAEPEAVPAPAPRKRAPKATKTAS